MRLSEVQSIYGRCGVTEASCREVIRRLQDSYYEIVKNYKDRRLQNKLDTT
jgi:hypothetical protein